jgi:hypothetical protein
MGSSLQHRPLLPAISLHQLATYPFCAGMGGRCETQDFAAYDGGLLFLAI